jgi:hypothetical protein
VLKAKYFDTYSRRRGSEWRRVGERWTAMECSQTHIVQILIVLPKIIDLEVMGEGIRSGLDLTFSLTI